MARFRGCGVAPLLRSANSRFRVDACVAIPRVWSGVRRKRGREHHPKHLGVRHHLFWSLPIGRFHLHRGSGSNERRGNWYLHQFLGSANIRGGRFFHLMSGNLSHQIEHHLVPDLCSNRYAAVARRVEAVAARYGLPYNSRRQSRQFGSTWWNNLRLACPGDE